MRDPQVSVFFKTSLACCAFGVVLFPHAECVAQAQVTAGVAEEWLVESSAAVSNLTAWVRIANPPTSSDKIYFGFSATSTNDMQLYLPPRWGPFCKIEMVDAQGRRLKKTEVAAKLLFLEYTNTFGSDYFRKHYGWKQLWPYKAHPKNEGGMALASYTPEQLFEIPKPGQYRLTIELQALQSKPLVMVSFSPITIPIQVPEKLKDRVTH